MTTVIFACIHNAGRSQMGAAFFNAMADPQRARAISAGTAPAETINPVVRASMLEVGIDLGNAVPKKLTDELARDASLLITLGCGEQCPFIPGLEILDWPLDDPKGQSHDAVRRIREEVRRLVMVLVTSRGWGR
jgi:arsenate reductase